MSVNKGLFSSMSCDWATPPAFFDALNKEFSFNDDPCPLEPLTDGLAREWGTRTYVKPPYGKECGWWVRKAYEEGQLGKLIVMLLPSRTDTKWWHEYVLKASEIRFVRGRLKFNGSKINAPFPSAIVVFGNYQTSVERVEP